MSEIDGISAIDQLSTAAQTVSERLDGAVVTIGRDGRGTGLVIGDGKVLTNAHNLRDRTTLVTFADGRAEQATAAGADEDGDLVVLDVATGAASPVVWAEQAPQRGRRGLRVQPRRPSRAGLVRHGVVGRRRVLRAAGPTSSRRRRAHRATGSRRVRWPAGRFMGRVLAVNTHRSGRGFYVARPVDASLRATIDKIAAGAVIARPRLGVALAPPDVAAKLRASVGLPPREGLLVRAVEPGSPAAAAQIVEGDLLVAVGDTPLTLLDVLYDAIAAATDSLTLTVVRGSDERLVMVVFAQTPV